MSDHNKDSSKNFVSQRILYKTHPVTPQAFSCIIPLTLIFNNNSTDFKVVSLSNEIIHIFYLRFPPSFILTDGFRNFALLRRINFDVLPILPDLLVPIDIK